MEFFHVESWSQETYTYVGEFASKSLLLFIFFCLNSQCKTLGHWLYRKMLGSQQLEKRIYLAAPVDTLQRICVFLAVAAPQAIIASLFIWLVWTQDFQLWIFTEVQGFSSFLCKLALLLALWSCQHHLIHGFKYAIAQLVFGLVSLHGVFFTVTPIVNHLDTWARKMPKGIISQAQTVTWLVVTNSILIFLFWLRTGGPLV